MPTISEQLTQLISDRDDLVDNLTTKGITGLTGNETFTELVPEVLNIPSGGSSGVTFDNVSYGLTQPSASQYKYWIPVDTTKELKPLKMVPQCYTTDNFISYSDSDDMTANIVEGDLTTDGNYRTYTKDYCSTSHWEENSGTQTFSYRIYNRDETANNIYYMSQRPYNIDTTQVATISSSTVCSDKYSNAYVGATTNLNRLDNKLYCIYASSSSQFKLVTYDISTRTRTVLGTFNSPSSSYTGSNTNLSLYVKNDNTFYCLFRTTSSTYKISLYKLVYNSSTSSITVTQIGSTISTSSDYPTTIKKINDRFIIMCPMVNITTSTASTRVVDTQSDIMYTVNNTISDAILESLSTYGTYTIYNATNTSYSKSMYIPGKDRFCSTLLTDSNNTNSQPVYIYQYTFDTSTSKFVVTPFLLITSLETGCAIVNTSTIEAINVNTKEINYWTTQQYVNYRTSGGTYSNAYKSINYIGKATPKDLTKIKCNIFKVLYSTLSSIPTTDNVVIPILRYQNSLQYPFYKFYLDENNNYTVVPVDNLKLLAFYNNARYNIYISNGTNWTDTVSSSDSDYISS